MRTVWLALLILALGAGAAQNGLAQRESPALTCGTYDAFRSPQRVTIQGYDGDAMEPFLTADGRYLLFNNRNAAPVDTNLLYASRIDDLTFAYSGEIEGVNSPALDGVPTMDGEGDLYFVSTRSYGETFSTIYRGRFDQGRVTGVELVEGVSREIPGMVNFDVEVSPDGETLYVVDARFNTAGVPQTADLVIAERHGEAFERLAESADLLANVNTDQLEYAAAISADGLELFFTRVARLERGVEPPAIYRAYRQDAGSPFGCPQQVSAIDGFAEAPTLSADGRSLYYHHLDGDAYVIYRVTRDGR